MQAELHLSAFSVLDPSKTDSNTKDAIDSFLKVVHESMRGMCRSSIPLGPALISKSEPAVLQSVIVDLGAINNNEIQLGCSDCPSYITNESYLQSGSSLIELYSSYVCNPHKQNCSTVCISSAQVRQYAIHFFCSEKPHSNVKYLMFSVPSTKDFVDSIQLGCS